MEELQSFFCNVLGAIRSLFVLAPVVPGRRAKRGAEAGVLKNPTGGKIRYAFWRFCSFFSSSSILFILIILVCGRSLVSGWSFVGRPLVVSLLVFLVVLQVAILINIVIQYCYKAISVGRSDGDFPGRF